MKTVLILTAILAVVFFASQLYFMNTNSNIESYPYSTMKKYQDIEIRHYESSLFTSVRLASSKYNEVSSKGFRILGGYIFGANEAKEKIAMTTPVTMTLEDTTTMMFMVPRNYSVSTLPKPNQTNIEFKNVPSKTVAAITFGGWANDSKIKKYKQKLIVSLQEKDIPFTNRFSLLGYNAPYELLNRKNEIIVELKEGYSL